MHRRNHWAGTMPLLALAIALGGCSSLTYKEPPPPDPNTYPAGYKQLVADFLRTYLNNPIRVKDAAISEPVLRPVGKDTRYVSCVRYNARDTRNQYQGIEEKVALFWGGSLNQLLPVEPGMCANVAYQRFPEAEAIVP